MSRTPYTYQDTDAFKSTEQLIIRGRFFATTVSDKFDQFEPEKRNIHKILNIKNKLLVPELLAVKRERMSKSLFAFFRGTVDVMHYDMSRNENSGIKVLVGGDAHLGNFGFYGSSEGQLLFDMNDFDEAHLGHWEYDLKRLLVSALLVARAHNFVETDVQEFLLTVVDTYFDTLKHMTKISEMKRFILPNTLQNITEIFGMLKDNEEYFQESFNNMIAKSIKKAQKSNSRLVIEKYTEVSASGERRFVENKPVTQHISEKDYKSVVDGYQSYKKHQRSDVRLFLEDFDIIDIVRHSVGVGSVGTLCYLILLQDLDSNYLVLQAKQALPIYNDDKLYSDDEISQGQNIVNSQLILQSASDPFLGAFDTKKYSFYMRQFKDMKSSINLDKLDFESFEDYTKVCVILLARAHSHSPNYPLIIGFGEEYADIANSLMNFTNSYVKQVEYDYESFKKEQRDERQK
ncbi:DUF2252 domain-containing protein [Companilactobacillus heilongjiangensis]|uniref:DUF2252 domain-containing protein n=1 Tax=Companilactobacillus heilongjiangensis TaxID=1074467 RepID=A0A0K2LF32_9LACO|nr:DUF2252 domain-containing protein [Companilactobacillus heilongjiangensis]ALB29880.1 hypothetical protein JP39_11230 [Companilactobacillus heilongjiangensis]